MNQVDVAIVATVAVMALLGLRRGLVLGALDLVGVVLVLLVAARLYPRLVDPLANLGLDRALAAAVAFVALTVAAQVAVGIVLGVVSRAVSLVPSPFPLGLSNRLLGLGPGLVKGLALATVVILPLAFVQRPVVLTDQVREAGLTEPLVSVGLDVIYGAADHAGVELADFAVVTSRPAEDAVDLPFTVTSGLAADEGDEAELLRLVNEERARAGLEPLTLDPALTAVARAHSEEMFRLGYFAHESPVTGEPIDRLRAAEIQFFVAGENLAYAPSVATAHEGLMESPGHRANILSPSYRRIGIGIIRSERRGIMVTQEFAA